jgi:hypothetical protein
MGIEHCPAVGTEARGILPRHPTAFNRKLAGSVACVDAIEQAQCRLQLVAHASPFSASDLIRLVPRPVESAIGVI